MCNAAINKQTKKNKQIKSKIFTLKTDKFEFAVYKIQKFLHNILIFEMYFYCKSHEQPRLFATRWSPEVCEQNKQRLLEWIVAAAPQIKTT